MERNYLKDIKREEKKQDKEKAFRERERQYKAIRTQERAKLLEELERAVNEKTKYIPVNETTCVPMVSIEDLMQVFNQAREDSQKIKKFTHF